MKEEFVKIENYEWYSISNLGRVYNNYYERFLSPSIDKRGYNRVNLWQDGKSKTFLVHRLVAQYFCKKDEICNIVHHIDNNPQNNNHQNLKWTTQSYNVKKAYEDGLVKCRKGINNPNYKQGKFVK
jgi:hypothetical protein